MHSVSMLHHDVCPLCGSTEILPYMRATDELVSGEEFSMVQCRDCRFVFIQTLPSEKDAQHYYDSPDYTPHQTGASGLKMRCVQLVRTMIREPFKLRLIKRTTHKKTGSFIDIGCGTGEFADFLQKKGWTVRCIEPNPDARAHCQSIGLQTDDVSALPTIASDSFDVVSLWHVLEHVYDIHGTMATVHRLLKPDGTALIAIPHYDCPQAHWYGKYWSGYEMPRHPSHFTPDTLKMLASAHGLTVTEMHALNLDDAYLAILSEQYMKSQGNIVRGILRGLWSVILSTLRTKNGSSIVYVLRKDVH